MRLINIYNQKRILHLFLRDEQGRQIIKRDSSFYPYFYEVDDNGTHKSFDGKPLRKVFCSEPSEVAKIRSHQSYEADVLYPRRYIIDRVKEIEPAKFRYIFLDIEVLTREFPDFKKPKAPISCISSYDSYTEKVTTWYLEECEGQTLAEKEKDLLSKFLIYMRETKPDLWFSWHVQFDYNYLNARIGRMAQQISPIGRVRLGDYENQIFYPAGISIVDYLLFFKKVYMREQSYRLDHIAHKYLGEEEWGETKFHELSPRIKEKNINDVMRMVKLERMFKIIPYYNEIRIMSRCQWEDLYHNSRIVEMLLFEEAKRKRVILPNKPHIEEKEEFKGAARDVGRMGVSYDIGKYDLSGAYPSMMIDFCLDTANISDKQESDTLKIDNTLFRQNANALLPSVLKKMLTLKVRLKKERDKINPDDAQYEIAKIRYDAVKGVVNSGYGVFGNRFFRLYDNRVASATTCLVREVLLHVKDELQKKKYDVIYWDTDSVFIDSSKNIVTLLNKMIVEWSTNLYGKKDLSLEFEYEGQFEKILILKKCRYIGYLNDGKHTKEEIKGLEVKRGDSSKFMSEFQRALIVKLFDKESKKKILAWILEETKRIKTLPLEQVAFPVKIARPREEYKNIPIFIRALEYANKLTTLEKYTGELFYYLYIIPKDYEIELQKEYYFEEKTERTLKSGKIKIGTRKKKVNKSDIETLSETDQKRLQTREVERKKHNNVVAFDKEVHAHVKAIDWNMMIERNIVNKADALFEALGWEKEIEELRGRLLTQREVTHV